MGLTADSTGKNVITDGLKIEKRKQTDRIIALAGNPNVGKSTVFNRLTGLNQHTGNWPGKTVTSATGFYEYKDSQYLLVDLPGTYSLKAHSAEEEVARDFVCFGESDAVVVVCDATCLERNLNLVLQTLEISGNVVVCINLMDEARKKGIQINLKRLQEELKVPVVGISARSGKGIDELLEQIEKVSKQKNVEPQKLPYTKVIEEAIGILEPSVIQKIGKASYPTRWITLNLLENEAPNFQQLEKKIGFPFKTDPEILNKLKEVQMFLKEKEITEQKFRDMIISCIILQSEWISSHTVRYRSEKYAERDRKLDKILTSKWTGIPIMIILLAVIFWITITGANYPSQVLSDLFGKGEIYLNQFFEWMHSPVWLQSAIVSGIYKVLTWVISVMLPPMAIFFPLFTLLEDFGYLPRIAFNLDKYFKKCNACGKQALTMAMGFGCNAAGIVGCRIIDSPRERLIAIITNNFVPCNGRFPTLIAIISMFFIGTTVGVASSFFSTLILSLVILLGIFMTFGISKLLSKTILKGVPSSFTLELPPYRKPQIGKVIIRSIFDRTLFVLGRAVVVAAPAGLIIWLMANIEVGEISILKHCTTFLDPFGRLIGLDGVILMAFILGFPANEIVIPIAIMTYLSNGTIMEFQDMAQLKELLVDNGWTWLTAICTMLFSLMHWPCSTACMTIKKETQSVKWTLVSFLVPTITGIIVCFLVATISRGFHLV